MRVQMVAFRWLGGVGAAALALVACSDTAFIPSKSSNDAGADGAAGSGGGDAAIACSKHADCDDGKQCNGTETCDGSFCKAGTPYCSNADPTNCDAVCTEAAGAPSCVTVATDADGDTYGSALCAAAPGADCDDTNKDVHPGATEQCDGVDADCDGIADIDDGFGLGGSETEIVSLGNPERPAAAWSPTAKRWGVVWQDTRDAAGDEEIFFALVDDAGKKVGQDIRITNAAGASAAPRIAWGHDAFAIVWQDDKGGNDDVLVQLVDAIGTKKGAATQLTNSTADDFSAEIVATPAGFLVAYTRNSTSTSELYAQQLTPAGVASGAPKLMSTGGHNVGARAAYIGPDIVLGWVTGPASATALTAGDSVLVKRVSQFLDILGSDNGSQVPPVRKVDFYIDIAATSTGYGVLYSLDGAGNKLAYTERKADGSAACAPVELTDIVQTATPLVAWVSALIPTASGPLGLAVDGGGSSKMILLRPGCTPKQAIPLSSGAAGAPFGALSPGDGKILAVWSDPSGSNHVLMSRVFGEALCN
jgi:hypothetical protein